LKVATLSSKKLGDNYEGSLKNNYLYQGAFAELDDDIGWTDFALRNYDAQIGRWVQMDPFDQFASPYVGMGGDPVNLIDPSGGVVVPPGGGSVLSMTAETAKTMGEVIVKVGPGLGSAAAKAGSGLTTKLLSGTGRALAVNAINTGAKINTHIATRAVSESTGQGRGVNRNLPSIKPKESEPFDLKKSAQIAAEKGPKLKALDPVAGSIAYATLNTAKDYVDGIADHAVGVYDGMKGHDWWGAAKNGGLLVLDVAPFAVKGGWGVGVVAEEGASLWPAASGGRTVINGIEYTTHALERMQPVGTIMKGTEMFSRGVPPSVVENAIKFGTVTSGNTAAEVVRTFENVRVITNPTGTKVISVIKLGH
jgi:RHS repeat-associated protein